MQTNGSFRVVIPARFESTRFPGKPLQLIDGKEMVLHVVEKASQSDATEVVVATDDQRILDVVQASGADVCLTATDHETGTDRLVEVVTSRGWTEDEVVVNVQGDEPLIPVDCINQVANNLIQNPTAVMSTLAMAMYFSRASIPYNRDGGIANGCKSYRHIGIYAYRAGYLATYPKLAASRLEALEKLEQLRVLDNGDLIHVDIARELPGPGVDTPEHLALVESMVTGSNPHRSGD